MPLVLVLTVPPKILIIKHISLPAKRTNTPANSNSRLFYDGDSSTDEDDLFLRNTDPSAPVEKKTEDFVSLLG